MEWDSTGDTLAVLCSGAAKGRRGANCNELLLWHSKQPEEAREEWVSLSVRDITFLRWARSRQQVIMASHPPCCHPPHRLVSLCLYLTGVGVSVAQLALGTARGELLMYDHGSKTYWLAPSKHKRRVTCGDWSSQNKFAFASDDKQVRSSAATAHSHANAIPCP